MRVFYEPYWLFQDVDLEQLSRKDFEGLGELHDVDQGDVLLAALDAGDVGSIEMSLGRKLLLGPLLFLPEKPQPLSEQDLILVDGSAPRDSRSASEC